MLVLPTPGPPVMTASLEPSTSRTASLCEGDSVLPVRLSTQGNALSRSIWPDGGSPDARSISRSAIVARRDAGPCRNTQASSPTVSEITSPPRDLMVDRRPD